MLRESTRQLLELAAHGIQCKIRPCSAAILQKDLPSAKSALLTFTQQTQHQAEPCAIQPAAPAWWFSATLSPVSQLPPAPPTALLSPQPCLPEIPNAQGELLGCCSLCRVRGTPALLWLPPLQNSWGFRKLKKENGKENDCFLRDH